MPDTEDTRKKVAIVGKAPSSRGLAPFDDPTWEIWTCSTLGVNKEVPRISRHFEIHPLDWYRKKDAMRPYYDWLTRCKMPVYLSKVDPAIPTGVAYPLDTIVERFGSYFTNTVSWMMALAIHEHASHIHVYGVDMAADTEYGTQRPSCEYFLGLARGIGIDIYVPPQADLLKSYRLYGFEHDDEFLAKWQTRQRELAQRHKAKQEQIDKLTREACFLEGALESQSYYRQWTGAGPPTGLNT